MDNNQKLLKLMTQLEKTTTFQLLKEFRNGVNPPKEDMYFISQIDLKTPVLNTLLYTVFLTNNGKLDKELIKKKANQWRLMQIETISEAMLVAINQNKREKKYSTA
jgi:replication initiation and membrane attachment protein DnaB